MKKSLLTLGALVAVAAGACGQGTLLFDIPSTVGVNSVSSSPSDPDPTTHDYFLNDGTGILNVSVYYSTNNSSLLNEATTINNDDKAGQVVAAATALAADFTQESFTGEGGAAAALSQPIEFDYGVLDEPEQYTATVGSGTTITSGSTGMYALLVTYTAGSTTWEGVMALNGTGIYNVGGGSSPAASVFSNWASGQNLLIAPVPEPATLALAGLGGLSMLFLRRRKV